MGVLSSVRAVRWARKPQPDQVSYWIALAHEQFPPDDLLRQAVEAEQAGFDGIGCSDHLPPWGGPGESGHARVWLRAAGRGAPTGPARARPTPPPPPPPPPPGAPAPAAPPG